MDERASCVDKLWKYIAELKTVKISKNRMVERLVTRRWLGEWFELRKKDEGC